MLTELYARVISGHNADKVISPTTLDACFSDSHDSWCYIYITQWMFRVAPSQLSLCDLQDKVSGGCTLIVKVPLCGAP